MRNLYRHLGCPAQADGEVVRQAIQWLAIDDPVREDAEYILLDPVRRKIYDRHWHLLTQLGQLRADMGLERTEHWLSILEQEFGMPAQPEFASHAAPSAGDLEDQAAAAWLRRWIKLMIIAVSGIGLSIWLASGQDEDASMAKPDAQSYLDIVLEHVLPSSDKATKAGRGRLPFPASGVLASTPVGAISAGVKLYAPRGHGNYLVKLVSNRAGFSGHQAVIFVREGTAARVRLPPGQYDMRFAVGESWYGMSHLFGTETQYARALHKLEVACPVSCDESWLEVQLPTYDGTRVEYLSAQDF